MFDARFLDDSLGCLFCFNRGAWHRGQNIVEGGRFWTGIVDVEIWVGFLFGRSFASGSLRDEIWFGSMEMLRCFAWGGKLGF